MTKSKPDPYISWNAKNFSSAAAAYGNALDSVQPIFKSTAAISNKFENITSNTSVRDSFSPADYAFFRPGERLPRNFRDIIGACLASYDRISQVKEIIDLMGDFTSQGIRLVHPDPEIQNFYTEWFNRVNGEERSERIANCLYKAGNVIIKRADALLDVNVIDDWKKTVAQQELDLEHEEDEPLKKNSIPYKYTIINPLVIEVLGEHLAAFTGQLHYVLKLPTAIYNNLSLPLTGYDPSLLTAGMPRDLQQAIDNNERYLLLDSNKLVTLFYKKDDWNVWAYPMLYSLLDEFMMLQKLKQADMCALDGVIAHIRIWKLGSMEHKIFPTDQAIQKLSSILLNHTGGGDMDFVWGPDITIEETKSDIGKFLGTEKYEFVLNTIHQGLGIPAAIGQSKGDMSSNSMSLRVLLERLVYGRKILTRFWKDEIKRVHKAMGFKQMPYIQYDNMVLHDETAEKALWIQLLDRDIVPASAVQARFGRIPEIDNLLIKREYDARNKGDVAVKVSPYHDSQPTLALTKIALQRGSATPQQMPPDLDLHLKDLTPKETDQHLMLTNPQTMLTPQEPAKKKPAGVSGQGRPSGKKDTKPRKERTPKTTKGNVELILKANKCQKLINEVYNPIFLEEVGKSSLRKLTDEESIRLEKEKFRILFNVPHSKADSIDFIKEIIKADIDPKDSIVDVFKTTADKIRSNKGEDLTFEEISQLKSYLYAGLME